DCRTLVLPAVGAIAASIAELHRCEQNPLPFFFFQAEDGIRDATVTGVQTCALPISITGLPAPEGSLEADQQPVEARGLGAVAALRGQHAEQPSVLLVVGVRASQVGSDRAGGVRVSRRIVGLGSLETHGLRSEERRVGTGAS